MTGLHITIAKNIQTFSPFQQARLPAVDNNAVTGAASKVGISVGIADEELSPPVFRRV